MDNDAVALFFRDVKTGLHHFHDNQDKWLQLNSPNHSHTLVSSHVQSTGELRSKDEHFRQLLRKAQDKSEVKCGFDLLSTPKLFKKGMNTTTV